MKKIIRIAIAIFFALFSFNSFAAVKGDVNGDIRVTIVDALQIAQYSVGFEPQGFLAVWADVNCDGNISIVDALMIAQYSVGLVSSFCSSDEPDAITFVKNLGIGLNLGNTLEACGDWIDKSSIRNFETAWGNPVTTQAMIDGMKEAGIKTVRIPVAWSNLMSPDYTIHPDLMNRVEEVVNYVLSNNMFAIVNIHWDGGWIAGFSTQYDITMMRFRSFWSQISERFKNYSGYLIFESMNEEGVWDDIWNRYSGNNSTKAQAFNLLNTINQEFVNLVRSSGGNNHLRYLLIAGYATDVDLTCDPAFRMPVDQASHSIVSVHYYTPATFTILTEDADWGRAASTWGTTEEVAVLQNNINKLKTRFIDNGIPVIIGEYGSVQENKDPASVMKFFTEVATRAYNSGICPVFWDGGFCYNRYVCAFNDQWLADLFAGLAVSPRP